MATTVTRKDRDAAIQYMQATKRPETRRTPTAADDFGDEMTVGLCVKRQSHNMATSDPNDSFGFYLGQHADGFVIGVHDLFFRPSAAEVYPTLEDLKADWRLD